MGRGWAAALAVVVVAVAACGGSDDDGASGTAPAPASSAPAPATSGGSTTAAPSTTTTAPLPTTIEEVVALVDATLDGVVYHGTVTRAREDGPDVYDATEEIWVDVGRDALRTEATYEYVDGPTTSTTGLIADGVTWYDGRPTSTVACWGTGAAVSVLLGCVHQPDGPPPAVEAGSWEGSPAIVLVTEAVREGSDSSETFTSRLYLDPATGLPLASESSGTRFTNVTWETSATARYDHELVDPASVPADLFDPAALGWSVSPEEDLPAGQPIAWLGLEVDPGAGFPPLVLAQVDPGLTPPGYVAILHYAPADDRFGPPALSIQVFPRAAWEDPTVHHNPTPCADRPPVAVPGGEATLQCTALGSVTGAIVDLGDLVLRVYPTGLQGAAMPYADADALTAVLGHLEVRAG
jgi:hypothetical protein